MKIRLGIQEDLDRILNVEERVFTDSWSRNQIQYELEHHPASKTWVLTEQDQIIGYLMAHRVGREIQIINLAIDLPWQHRGFGKKLLHGFLRTLDKDTAVFLEVRTSNLAAIKLYLEAGFTEVGIRDHYYDNGEDAVVMRLDTC